MFQIEIGQRDGRMFSIAYYPLIEHSIGSQIHTAPDSLSSCTTFKPENNLLPVTKPEGNRYRQYQKLPQWDPRSVQVICTSWGRETCPGLYLNKIPSSSPEPDDPGGMIKTTADMLKQIVKTWNQPWQLPYSDQLETARNRASVTQQKKTKLCQIS